MQKGKIIAYAILIPLAITSIHGIWTSWHGGARDLQRVADEAEQIAEQASADLKEAQQLLTAEETTETDRLIEESNDLMAEILQQQEQLAAIDNRLARLRTKRAEDENTTSILTAAVDVDTTKEMVLTLPPNFSEELNCQYSPSLRFTLRWDDMSWESQTETVAFSCDGAERHEKATDSGNFENPAVDRLILNSTSSGKSWNIDIEGNKAKLQKRRIQTRNPSF